MSNRFAIFLLAVWMPLMLIGGPAVGDYYIAEFNKHGRDDTAHLAMWHEFLILMDAP